MKLRTVLGAIGVLLLSNTNLVHAQMPTENTYSVTKIDGGFIQNKEVAVTINVCQQQDQNQCYFITLNRSLFLDLLAAKTIENHRDNNPSLDASAELHSKRFTLSKEYDTDIKLAVTEMNHDQITLNILGQLSRPTEQQPESVDYARLAINELTIPKEKLHQLKSWLGLSLNGAEQKYNELSDCDFAKRMINDTSPLFVKAVDLWQNKTSPEDFTLWQNETFQPQYNALRQIYDPIDYRHNRKHSKLMHENYLIPIGDFVSAISIQLRTGQPNAQYLKSAKLIINAAYTNEIVCNNTVLH